MNEPRKSEAKMKSPKMRARHNPEEAEIYGDVLEAVLSHVTAVDLVSASHVSKRWHGAVSSSLRHHNPPKPWLLLHTQSTRPPHATTSHAYDPRSDVWINIRRPPIAYVSALRSSAANFLYMLSPSRFAFSLDPLHSGWETVAPPRVWRQDPLVARVGDAVVVAGGACYFEDDSMAVEIYDLRARAWGTCSPMPPSMKDSAASPWLSAAATDENLIVVDTLTGLTHCLDPETGSWSGPFVLNPSQPCRSYRIGFSGKRLILIAISPIENGETVRLWRIGENDFALEEIGEMPQQLATGLRDSFGELSIDMRVAGDFLYVYNPSAAEAVVACELIGGGCRWWTVKNMMTPEQMISKTAVLSCCEVGIGELERAMATSNWRFEVIE